LRAWVRWYLENAAIKKVLIECSEDKTPLAFVKMCALALLGPCRALKAMGVNERQRMHNCLKLQLKPNQI